MSISFTNLTRGNEIGANCYHLDVHGMGILLDAGMHPKIDGPLAKPALELIQDKPVDALLLSHCHLDHVGALPLVANQHPDLQVIMTVPSYHLIDRVLHNSVNIMMKLREELGIVEYPFFTHSEIERLAGNFVPFHCNRPLPLDFRSKEPVTVSFHESGHIMGAAGVLIEADGKKIFYTGDVNFRDQKITQRAHFPEESIDILIAETTRGGKQISEQWSWENEENKLGQAIVETFERGGSVLIPIFALGKTQEMLFMMWEMMQKGLLEHQTIYIGGLGSTFTKIHDQLSGRTSRLNPDFKFFKEMDLAVIDHEMTRQMDIGAGKLMLISAGMMTRQTSSYILGQRMFDNPLHSIFFVGYCDPDSPAAKILGTPPMGEVQLEPSGPVLRRRCRLEHFDFSSHCNRDEMIEYMLKVKPKTILLVHGDRNSLTWFKQTLKTRLPKSKVIIPEPGKTFKI